MNAFDSEATAGAAGGREFRTTHWSVVLQAGRDSSIQSAQALEQLCRTYWYPLYAFARRTGLTPHDAQDATQSFFEHLLEKSMLAKADPQRGRFRSFLLTSFKNQLGLAHRKATAQRRGGGAQIISLDETAAEDCYVREPADAQDPGQLFERRWVLTLIELVLQRLESEYVASGKAAQFAAMKPYLTGDQGRATFAQLATQLGSTEGAARVAVHRLRQRYHELFRTEVAQTVTSAAELEEELRHIAGLFSG